MKKLLIGTLVAALGGALVAPQTVAAKDGEVLAALGGFIGGVIVGSNIDNNRHRHASVSYRYVDRGIGTRVVIATGRPVHRGHWKLITVRTWVPGRWVVHFDDCGRRVRYYERGHYVHRRERVWVNAGGRRHHRDRYSR